jgi:hypothetical protein
MLEPAFGLVMVTEVVDAAATPLSSVNAIVATTARHNAVLKFRLPSWTGRRPVTRAQGGWNAVD